MVLMLDLDTCLVAVDESQRPVHGPLDEFVCFLVDGLSGGFTEWLFEHHFTGRRLLEAHVTDPRVHTELRDLSVR